jgi:Mn-containing catalase
LKEVSDCFRFGPSEELKEVSHQQSTIQTHLRMSTEKIPCIMTNSTDQMMSTISKREEAHWHSFRDAVTSIQKTLIQKIPQLSSNELTTHSPQENQTDTPRFAFSGLEKVKASTSIAISNTNIMISPLNEDVKSEALSNAEKQLAEMRVQLALAESERDELEFQLMQSQT